MKRVFILLCFCLLLGCKSKKPDNKLVEVAWTKVPVALVNDNQKKSLSAIGTQLLLICNTSKFTPLTEKEATPAVIKNMTVDRMTKTCLKFRLKYGDFKELKWVETYQNNQDKNLIYRFKALYKKKIANKELRITVDENQLISAINSKDWTDKFQK